MMPVVGYARVSNTGQDLAVQLEKLERAGCKKVFKEKRSGVDAGRPELKQCLEYLREGDTLLVTKIDRLARSTSDLYRIISDLEGHSLQLESKKKVRPHCRTFGSPVFTFARISLTRKMVNRGKNAATKWRQSLKSMVLLK